MATSVVKGLYISLIRFRGLFGGVTGIFLSLFWGWYIVAAGVALSAYNSGMFVYGFTASAVFTFAVSRLTPPQSAEQLARYFGR